MTRSEEHSPRHLAALLAPGWRFDEPAIEGFRLEDIYRLGDDDRMIIELVGGERSARIAVTNSRSFRSGSG